MTAQNGAPTEPEAFGRELRRLRASAGLELEDIAAETKISLRILNALEAGKFQFLPERIFSRNFVRQCAATIGCEQERLVTAFDEAWERFQLASGTHPDLIVAEAPPRASIRWRFWFPIAAGVGILLIAAVVILTGSQPGDELIPDPRRSLTVSRAPATVSERVPVIPSELPVQRVTREESDLISVTVRVAEDKECWIQYRDGEGMTDQRLLFGGQELELQLRGPVKFTVGNAAAVTLVVGEVEYRDLGLSGQVVHTEVTRDGLTPLGSGARYD